MRARRRSLRVTRRLPAPNRIYALHPALLDPSPPSLGPPPLPGDSGGPNYEAGLDAMRRLGVELGIPIDVYGPDRSMTAICKLAVEWLGDADGAAVAKAAA